MRVKRRGKAVAHHFRSSEVAASAWPCPIATWWNANRSRCVSEKERETERERERETETETERERIYVNNESIGLSQYVTLFKLYIILYIQGSALI